MNEKSIIKETKSVSPKYWHKARINVSSIKERWTEKIGQCCSKSKPWWQNTGMMCLECWWTLRKCGRVGRRNVEAGHVEFNGQTSWEFTVHFIYKIQTKVLCTRHSLLLRFYMASVGIGISNSEIPQKSESSNGFQENNKTSHGI